MTVVDSVLTVVLELEFMTCGCGSTVVDLVLARDDVDVSGVVDEGGITRALVRRLTYVLSD